jgi:hypothetical protein
VAYDGFESVLLVFARLLPLNLAQVYSVVYSSSLLVKMAAFLGAIVSSSNMIMSDGAFEISGTSESEPGDADFLLNWLRSRTTFGGRFRRAVGGLNGVKQALIA